MYFDVVDQLHWLGTVKTTSTGSFKFEFDIMDGYPGTHTIIAAFENSTCTISFNLAATIPMDQRLIDLLNWIYGNLTMTLDELEAMFLVNGSFYNFINDWFNIIYGGIMEINTTANHINSTVNMTNGTVTIINGTVNDIQNTTNYVWQWVQDIEDKLDPGGSFYSSVESWFTYLYNNMSATNETIGDIWNEVQSIELKLDPNGSFYNFTNSWFGYIFDNMTLMNLTLNNLNTTLYQMNTTISQINSTVASMSEENGMSGSVYMNITTPGTHYITIYNSTEPFEIHLSFCFDSGTGSNDARFQYSIGNSTNYHYHFMTNLGLNDWYGEMYTESAIIVVDVDSYVELWYTYVIE